MMLFVPSRRDAAHRRWPDELQRGVRLRLLRFVASEAMLVDFERADLRFQRRSRDSESRRCPGRAGYPALARGERRLDSRSLVGCQFVIHRRFSTRLAEALPHEPTLIDA